MAEAAGPSTGATGVNTMAEVKQRPLTQRVETMASVIELLLETLKDLSDWELETFKEILLSQTDFHRRFSESSWMLMKTADSQVTVFLMVLTYGQQSVETTKEVLKKMKRTDLVQRLSDSSSGPKKKHCVDEHLSALIHKVATMCANKELLLGTLRDLSSEELNMFKWLLQFTLFERNLPHISWRRLPWTDRADKLVDVMMEMYGQRSVEVTKEVFMNMNKTDLVQRLLETSSSGYTAAGASAEAFGVDTTEKEKHCVDEHWPALIQKVETMATVIELLLEILKDLSDGELEKFKKVLLYQTDFQRRFPDSSWMLMKTPDRQVTVFLMVLTDGQQSVETTKEVLKKMERTDLVQRLSDSSSGPKKKHSDEHRPALIQKAATMAAVKHLLLETLNDLSNEELKKFKKFLQMIVSQKKLRNISFMFGHIDRTDLVDQMVQTCGQQSLELTREVVKEMNRTDLMQRLSETSSGLKEKHSVDEHRPALLEKAAARAAVNQILLETLKDLSVMEVEKFKWLLQFTYFQKGLPHISWRELDRANTADALVDLMVENQQSVEVTKEVFMDMNRTDLVERLSESSSRLKEKQSKLLQEMEILLETLRDLSDRELEMFKSFLQDTDTIIEKGLLRISRHRIKASNRVEIVELMVETYGRQSVEVTREVLMEMNKRGLMQKVSDISSGSKETRPKHKEVTMKPLMEKLLETLRDLSDGELEMFKHALQFTKMEKGLPRISGDQMETASRVEIVELMVETYGQQSVEVTREVLKKMNKRDLMQKVSDISSGSKGPSRSSELEGGGSIKQVSSDWIKLEPEVNSSDADEAPTYSLQSEAGHFECSVSGLRWVCKESVSFKYQFFSVKEHMERIESLQYLPAGPLIDITVVAGKLDVVYLPHWICIDDNPTILDKFAVLHIDDCGAVVENVSEVTSSHVKLSEPVFSLKMVLVKLGFPWKIDCKVLIYKTNTSSLTLRVYQIPPARVLIEELDKIDGYTRIRKQHPKKPLKMRDWFTLTADLGGEEIYSDKLKFKYEPIEPNFFEVSVKNPDTDLVLKLKQGKNPQPVWTCVIPADECQSSQITGPAQDKPSVDERLSALMKKAAAVTTDKERLLIMLEDLKMREFDSFTWHLQNSGIGEDERIPSYKLENISMRDLVDEMWNIYIQKSVEVTKKVLENINRKDLVKILSETSSGSKDVTLETLWMNTCLHGS